MNITKGSSLPAAPLPAFLPIAFPRPGPLRTPPSCRLRLSLDFCVAFSWSLNFFLGLSLPFSLFLSLYLLCLSFSVNKGAL